MPSGKNSPTKTHRVPNFTIINLAKHPPTIKFILKSIKMMIFAALNDRIPFSQAHHCSLKAVWAREDTILRRRIPWQRLFINSTVGSCRFTMDSEGEQRSSIEKVMIIFALWTRVLAASTISHPNQRPREAVRTCQVCFQNNTSGVKISWDRFFIENSASQYSPVQIPPRQEPYTTKRPPGPSSVKNSDSLWNVDASRQK